MAIRQSTLEGVVMRPSQSFWAGKRVLLTGHTGYKGSWLAIWLHRLGARVTGVSLPPATNPNLFSLAGVDALIDSRFADIREADRLAIITSEVMPEIVLHLAAQSLVRVGYRRPLETYATNVMGTIHLLEALRGLGSVKAAIIITTDKVYQNQEWSYPYRETDPLGGHDPYSASKAAAEIITASYRDAFLAKQKIAVATARAGNVIGGGDWSEDRLIPDAVRAWSNKHSVEIRNPQAIRPWQHVLEPLAGYLALVKTLWHSPDLAGAYNFGPETGSAATVREVVEYASECCGGGHVLWGNNDGGPHEAGQLALETSKAKTILGIGPRWSLTETIKRTMNWYAQVAMGADPRERCCAEIADYEALL